MAAEDLTSGPAEKSAGDTVRLAMDFGDIPRLNRGATVTDGVLVMATNITSYDVTAAGAGAPTVSGKQLDYPYQLSALFAGGTPGTYEVTFRITLDDADSTIIRRVAKLKVK